MNIMKRIRTNPSIIRTVFTYILIREVIDLQANKSLEPNYKKNTRINLEMGTEIFNIGSR